MLFNLILKTLKSPKISDIFFVKNYNIIKVYKEKCKIYLYKT